MLAARIKQETRARFDDAAQAESFEQIANVVALLLNIRVERIESVMIQSDGNGGVTNLGKNLQGVVEAMVRETVGVVAKAHHGTASMYATSGTCLRSSSSMPLTTSMMELGQFPHTPPSRMRATPSV